MTIQSAFTMFFLFLNAFDYGTSRVIQLLRRTLRGEVRRGSVNIYSLELGTAPSHDTAECAAFVGRQLRVPTCN